MDVDRDRATVQDNVETQDEPAEKQNFLVRLSRFFSEMQVINILRFYRAISFLLSALLFILFPGNFPLYSQLALLFLILAASVLMVFLYDHYLHNHRALLTLITTEVLLLSLLLAFTGGFRGPFLWYTLNPFIVCITVFPFTLSWLFLGTLLAGTFIWKIIIFRDILTFTQIFNKNFYDALNLVVIMVLINLFTRMHLTITEQSQVKRKQQEELLSAYQNLSANYDVFQGLSLFQRDVVSYKHQKDIYTVLLDRLISIFPFQQATILIPPPDFQPLERSHRSSFQVISSNTRKSTLTEALMMREIERRWNEFSSQKGKRPLIGYKREWIALPMHGEGTTISAIFVGWIKPGVNPLSFSDNLSLFISFAEQTTAWLAMFKQKERVLQHISSIYEAVETASSLSDPSRVIDLFASYARALTNCDKCIFWIENSGVDTGGDYNPIYSVKGPRDLFPESDWEEALLGAWSKIRASMKPAVVDFYSPKNGHARMISVPVKTGNQCLGMLAGIQSNQMFSTQENIQTLTVLADLSAIAVERTKAEHFAEKLLVIDEQKRIATEIHDSISQNLFSIVYSIDALTRAVGDKLGENIKYSLNDIKVLSAETARELRALIYRLNPHQEAEKAFIEEIKNYLDKMARMNNVKINHFVEGNIEYLNPAVCKALYRIVKESTGNAIRHGNCTEIMVQLDIYPSQSTLKVSDNGSGFDAQSSLDLYSSGNRLGLVNMRELALTLQGNLTIKSKPNKGTELICTIPTTPVSVK